MAVPNVSAHHEVPQPQYPDFSTILKAKMANPPSPSDKTARSSFSSVRENDDGLAQTFTRSKVSSYTQAAEEVFDESPSSEIAQPMFQAPLTQPHSRLHGFWYPADSFRGWKQIPIKGKSASRSCEDLHKLSLTWSCPAPPVKKVPDQYATGTSPLERLPSEVLGAIIDLLVIEIPPNGLTPRNADLMALLLTSRSIHAATLNTLYRHITIPHSRIFRKFLTTISEYPALASIVRRLDFSHFNPSTIFSTASERAKTKNLTSETLLQCLELTPYLQEFLAQEYVDSDLSVEVLRKLFFDTPRLQAVDFCGSFSTTFKNSFTALAQLEDWPTTLSLTRVSFHKCLTLPASVFEAILPRLDKVTHLDLAGTRVTDEALESIPHSARITHLNLAKCKELSSEAVVKFITSHPAVSSLVVLSLATDASSHLLLGKDDIEMLVPQLPTTLRSLSLKGSRMDPSHIPLLVPLIQHLEELALGCGLELGDIHRLFSQDQQWLPHNLRYLDISDMNTIIGSASAMLAPATAPLHVIELEERAYERAAKVRKNLERIGWTAKEFGSRYWLVRLNADGSTRDNGARWWKMGAESWGMRKFPVAVADVGGMYGSFMFGRRL